MQLPEHLMKQEKLIIEGVSKTILFNLSGHGHFDISAYEKYFEGNLPDHELTTAEVEDAIAKIDVKHDVELCNHVKTLVTLRNT